MNVQDLLDHLLNLSDPGEQHAFLQAHREDLSPECLAELKVRSDKLALENPRQALALSEVVLMAASFVPAPWAEAQARWARGNAQLCLGQYKYALDDYDRACALYRQQERDAHRLEIARLQTNMVAMLKNLGRYAEALVLADAARDALQPWEQSHYMSTLEMNVGSVYRLLGRYPGALEAYERGRAIFVALGNEVQAARMDINRARILVCLDRFQEAEPLLIAASRNLVEQGKLLPAARADLNLATLLSRRGQHRQALETYRQARAAFATLEVETDVAVTDLYSTFDYLALNLLPEALELSATAQDALARQEMPRYVALAAGNRAVAARKMGRYTESLDALNEARSIFVGLEARVEAARLDLERAVCLREMGELEMAVAVATAAAEILGEHNLPLQSALAYLTLGDCLLAQGEVDQGSSQHALALEALGDMPSLAWRVHDGLGRAAQARGQVKQAFQHYQEAIACIESVEDELGLDEFRAGFLDDKLGVYQRAVQVALALGDQELAFHYAEQSKTGVWRDFLAELEPGDERRTELRALRQQWHWLYNRLTRPDEDEPGLRGDESERTHWTELRALERRIAQARRESYPTLRRHPGLPLSAVQQRIPTGALLLDYYCLPQEISVFLIGKAGVQVFERLAPLKAVERLTNRWRFNLESVRLALLDGQSTLAAGLLSEAHEVLQELHRLLVEPVASCLQGHDALWIVPHGPLWEVPFAALHDGKQYLVERFELTCLPGLVEGQGKKALLSNAPLVVGYSNQGQLACAVDEAQAVADALGEASLLLEEEATSDKLRRAATACTLLHLATHGFFRDDAPLFSALRLADGLLTAGDLEEWRMPQVELVTLSACETGVSLSWGSDLLGLTRGFLRAGARQLLVSLWAVDDACTAELMARFYDELQAGQDVAPALRAAQVNILHKHRRHPFYWAGFELVGLLNMHQN